MISTGYVNNRGSKAKKWEKFSCRYPWVLGTGGVGGYARPFEFYGWVQNYVITVV